MFDTEPRSQIKVPEDSKSMTLDDFQKAMNATAQKMKDEMFLHITIGVASGLDPELMLAITNRELSKLGEGI